MKLNILLHDFSRRKPFGGIKQQYELANRLAEVGYDVAIYHSLNLTGPQFARATHCVRLGQAQPPWRGHA